MIDFVQYLSPKRKRGILVDPSLALRAQIMVLLIALTGSTARADLDPETKKPYQLQIVLRVGGNRVITPLFQEQLQRDVQNQLKIAFGELARIEVVREHPLLRDIDDKGLTTAVESWDSLSDHTTHFVLLDYADGSYQIQTRFHDGTSGLPGALTQRKQTTDRQNVAATIVQLVETSFSPVGTITAIAAGGKEATLKLQGGELGVSLDRWVKRGHVFAVSKLVGEGGRQRAERIEWALLEVVDGPTAGTCKCRYWRRYEEDALTTAPGTLGFRALHLPTVAAPVKLHLLTETDARPAPKLTPIKDVDVFAQRGGSGKNEKLTLDRNGLATSAKPFAHFAIVQVLSTDKVRAEFPVEIIAGRTAVARIPAQTGRESLSLTVQRDAWVNRVYDNIRISTEREHDLARLLNQSLDAALQAARGSLPILEGEVKYLERERNDLERRARDKKQPCDLGEGEKQLEELRKQAVDLKAFVERIDGVVKTSAGDDRELGLLKLIERAQLLELDADFDAAIRLFDQAVQAAPGRTAKIQAHLDQLKKAWAVKDDEHAKARAFVYQTWPTLDSAGLFKNKDEAKKALAACRAAQDKLTPQKFLRVNIAHTASLKKELETLKRRDTEDNRNRAKALVQVTEILRELHAEASLLAGPRKE
ncbi:MAG: hypothetical protein HY289_05710 [Planctomycetes bacterium]|nr:hypothetical protein [Planctomycetota bacterium]